MHAHRIWGPTKSESFRKLMHMKGGSGTPTMLGGRPAVLTIDGKHYLAPVYHITDRIDNHEFGRAPCITT